VTVRGIEGRSIAMDDRDRSRWLEQLELVVHRHGWRLFAFALMGNHFHLFFQTPRPNLSRGMHDLNGGYVNFFNARHEREGHLFQGRFKAFVVEDEGYWLEVSRYVHLNPVRAKIVARPEDWRWSSYGGYHRPALRLDWVDYGPVLAEFGGDDREGQKRYRAFVEEGLGEELNSPFDAAVHNLVLGSARLVESVMSVLSKRERTEKPPPAPLSMPVPSLTAVLDAVAAHYGVEPQHWKPGRRSDSPARSVAAYLAREVTDATDVEIAHGLGYSSVSSVVRACQRVTEGIENPRSLGALRSQLQSGSRD